MRISDWSSDVCSSDLLHGLMGRQAGSLAGFNYSPALKASKIRWTEKTLDEYLAAPTKKVPGTRMVVRVADPARRASLIAYPQVETTGPARQSHERPGPFPRSVHGTRSAVRPPAPGAA